MLHLSNSSGSKPISALSGKHKISASLLALAFLLLCTTVLYGQAFKEQSHKFYRLRINERVLSGMQYVYIQNDNVVIWSDSVHFAPAKCSTFSIPETQPFVQYFMFIRHEAEQEQLYIVSPKGKVTVLSGGPFWAAPRDGLLFILSGHNHETLLVYSLKGQQVYYAKFTCDEFSDWYAYKSNYVGKVEMECHALPEKEKEINEWLHPIMVERYDPASNTLSESFLNAAEMKQAKPLGFYGSCP